MLFDTETSITEEKMLSSIMVVQEILLAVQCFLESENKTGER